MTSQRQPLPNSFKLSDPVEFAKNIAKAFEIASQISQKFSENLQFLQKQPEAHTSPTEQMFKTLGKVVQAYMADPQKLMDAQMHLWSDYSVLWQNIWRNFLGEKTSPLVYPENNDQRFHDEEWQENSFFDFIKQFYLISSRWARNLVLTTDGLDQRTKQKARFYIDQLINFLSPSNFALTNPEVLRAILTSNGSSLVEGLKRLQADMDNPDGHFLRIKQTDSSPFAIGKNIAITPGKVVFRNDIIELIQYSPTQTKSFTIPLLIIPPWINKFYILDLNKEKSFVAWAIAQGFTVFIVSWINASQAQAHKTFTDYMQSGLLEAIEAVQAATASSKINIMGYCIGGTLVSAALGYMAAKNQIDKINSVTFLATQVDFESAGDLLVYIDEEQVKWLEHHMAEKGYLPGRYMANAFNLLRSNELIWSYVINSYMLGKDPAPFDLLYWSSDTTGMPVAVHSFYLRECYIANSLARSKMQLDGVTIDLSCVKIPIYNLAARDDHIAPMISVAKLGTYFGGKTRFVVTCSGHIAGVVNPPSATKYQYLLNDAPVNKLDEWMKGATEHEGSWWVDWQKWITPQSGKKITSPKPGSGKLTILEDAPGSYVRMKEF